jgi:hypothetical protein
MRQGSEEWVEAWRRRTLEKYFRWTGTWMMRAHGSYG